MNHELNAYVPDVIFEKIPIKNLVSCQDYQRSLSETQILKIAREFDLHQINPIKVSRRDGIHYVFDGQHTIEAVALVSHSRDTPVWCMIYDHLCYEHEAHIFAEQQKHHRTVAPYWNSTTLDCTRKFCNFIGSYRAVRKLSDLICAEHRLSAIENPQKHGLSYNKWRGDHDRLSNRDLLRMAIDAALEKQPQDFDALLVLLKSSGYSVSRKGRLSLRHENQKQSIRLDSLGEGYSEQELRAVLAGCKAHKPFVKKKYPKRKERTTLISDIEAKLNSGKGYWYDQTMKVVKLKQMAKTLVYLEEKGFADFDALAAAAADAEGRFYELKAAIKAAEARMSEIQTLRTHIINYSKTREVYAGYRKAGYSQKYLVEHESEILIHKAAKKAFDDFGLKKLPTVRSLNEEFAKLLAEKKAAYAEYHRAQEQMRELMIHKANAAYLLGLEERKQQITERQREEK